MSEPDLKVLWGQSGGCCSLCKGKLIAEKPHLRPLMERLTLAAFGEDPKRIEGLIVPGVIHVVSMPGWTDTTEMLEEVRSRS